MAGGKKSGKKSGGKKADGRKAGGTKAAGGLPPGNPRDHVIEFTPEGGFNIRLAAVHFSRLMENSGQALIIHLQHVSVEFEPGCTPKEIVEGFNRAMRARFTIKPSNANVKGGK